MASESAELIAAALEAGAESQDRGNIEGIGLRYDDVCCEILPINDMPDQLLGLALLFWDDWCDASQHEWQYHKPFVEADWPRMARTIAVHVRAGTLPEDEAILEHFLPKPKKPLLERIKEFFN